MTFAQLIIFNLIFAVISGGNLQSILTTETEPPSVPPDARITLSEAGLLITITADGRVAAEGQTFDFDIGRIKMKISPAEVQSLLGGFERIGYFSLKDRYFEREDGCADSGRACKSLTTITTSLTLNRATKSVTRLQYECLEKDGSGYPRALVALEQQIREVVDLQKR